MNMHVSPPTRQAANFSRYVKPAHMRTARMVGYSLATLDEPAMWELAAVLSVRLAEAERRFLAAGALLALGREGQAAVFDFVEGRCP